MEVVVAMRSPTGHDRGSGTTEPEATEGPVEEIADAAPQAPADAAPRDSSSEIRARHPKHQPSAVDPTVAHGPPDDHPDAADPPPREQHVPTELEQWIHSMTRELATLVDAAMRNGARLPPAPCTRVPLCTIPEAEFTDTRHTGTPAQAASTRPTASPPPTSEDAFSWPAQPAPQADSQPNQVDF
jgi:hypothetical protein